MLPCRQVDESRERALVGTASVGEEQYAKADADGAGHNGPTSSSREEFDVAYAYHSETSMHPAATSPAMALGMVSSPDTAGRHPPSVGEGPTAPPGLVVERTFVAPTDTAYEALNGQVFDVAAGDTLPVDMWAAAAVLSWHVTL